MVQWVARPCYCARRFAAVVMLGEEVRTSTQEMVMLLLSTKVKGNK
jgi:hypothetical protein